MEAERDVIAMLKLEFMKDKLGEVYEGIITGVTQFGFFVQLREYFVEGLVHVSTLDDDYYHYVEKLHCLRGERQKRVYRLGDAVKVQRGPGGPGQEEDRFFAGERIKTSNAESQNPDMTEQLQKISSPASVSEQSGLTISSDRILHR